MAAPPPSKSMFLTIRYLQDLKFPSVSLPTSILTRISTTEPMTVAARVKSIISGRPAGDGEEPSQGQTHDQHVQIEQEEFLPPLRPVILPKVDPHHQPALHDHGWTSVTYDTPTDKLHEASQALFKASQAFFALPESYKETFQTEIGSEEGWLQVEGEKELITLRCLGNTPNELKDAAAAYWAEAGGLLNEILGRIAESLGLPAEALTQYSEPCVKLPIEKTATMLRLFRYEGFEGKESRTVAERKFNTLSRLDLFYSCIYLQFL